VNLELRKGERQVIGENEGASKTSVQEPLNGIIIEAGEKLANSGKVGAMLRILDGSSSV